MEVLCAPVRIGFTIRAIVLTFWGVLLSILYFRKLKAGFLKEGVILGAIWFVMSVVIESLPNIVLMRRLTFRDTSSLYLIYPVM